MKQAISLGELSSYSFMVTEDHPQSQRSPCIQIKLEAAALLAELPLINWQEILISCT